MLPEDKLATIIIKGNEVNVNGKKYETYKKVNEDTDFSNIYITTDNKYVFKRITDFLEYDVFEREVYLLDYLNDVCNFTPKLIKYDKDTKIMMMNYCGISLYNWQQKYNSMPTSAKILDQMKNIGKTLKEHNIKHNDIKLYDEFLILNDKLYLCDFGWGSIGNDHSCKIGLWNGKKPFGYVNFGFNPPKFTWDNDNPKFYDNMDNTV